MKIVFVLGLILSVAFQWTAVQASTGALAIDGVDYSTLGIIGQVDWQALFSVVQDMTLGLSPKSAFYLPFGLGDNASELANDPIARLKVNIIWTIGILIVLWFAIRMLSLKVIGPMIYRKLNGEYDAQYNSYYESSAEADAKENRAAQSRTSQTTAQGGAVNQRGGFGRR